MRSWEDLRVKLDLDRNKKNCWIQVIHRIAGAWKEIFVECGSSINNLIINEHHLIKKHQIYCLEIWSSRKLYHIPLRKIYNLEKSTAQTYFEKNFQNPELEWKDIGTLTGRVTIDTNLRIFKYKSLHNILYLYEMFCKFQKKGSPTLLFLHGRAWEPNSSFSFLYKSKLSLDMAATFFPKCTDNPSNYTTERYL